MMVLPVPLDRLDEVIPRVQHWIARAVDASPKDGWTVDDAIEKIRRGQVALWVAVSDKCHGIALTEIVSERETARIVMLSGERMREWLHGLALIEAWAWAWRCRRLEVPGRDGWRRVLEPMGYAVENGELGKVL